MNLYENAYIQHTPTLSLGKQILTRFLSSKTHNLCDKQFYVNMLIYIVCPYILHMLNGFRRVAMTKTGLTDEGKYLFPLRVCYSQVNHLNARNVIALKHV